MSLGYSSLNGLGLITGTTSGYGGYGYYGGLSNSAYVENAKNSIANSYSLRTAQQSYSNKQSTEANSINLKCQTIKDMLQDGRSDDAISAFNNLVQQVSDYGQYAGYSETDIKALLQNQYAAACNSTFLGDISKYADSSFVTGLKNSNPITMFLCQSNSKGDLKAQATDEPAANMDTFMKCAGAAVGGAGFGLTVSGLNMARKSWKAAKNTVTSSEGFFKTLGIAGGKLLDKVKNIKGSKVKWIAIGGAAIGLACVAGKWIYDKVTDNSAAA